MTLSFFTTQLVVVESELAREILQQQLIETLKLPTNLPSYAWHWVVEPEEKISIEVVRQLQMQLAYATSSPLQIFVIPRLETATVAAQNALLKIVEEPPAQTLLILLTSSLDAIVPTIQSRTELRYIAGNNSDKAAFELPFSLDSLTPQQVMAWTEKISERDEALQVCEEIITTLMKEGAFSNNQKKLTQLKLVQNAWNDLQLNLNVKLTLEHYFLAISLLNKPV